MKFFALNFLFILSSITMLGSESTETPTTPIENRAKETILSAIKGSAAVALALGAHNILEFIATYMHEHGHGVTRGENYNVIMIPTNNVLNPWNGITPRYTETHSSFFTLLAGPLTGLTTTYIQTIALTMLKAYSKKKSLRTAFYKGLQFPIAFFANAMKTGKKYSSMILKQQQIRPLKKKTLELSIDILLHLRMGRMIAESIYGLLPYKDPSEFVVNAGGGDGEKIWKMIFGEQVPTFTGNLPAISLAILIAPYVIGAVQGAYETMQEKPTAIDPAQPS